jgi:hypothetical protein
VEIWIHGKLGKLGTSVEALEIQANLWRETVEIRGGGASIWSIRPITEATFCFETDYYWTK